MTHHIASRGLLMATLTASTLLVAPGVASASAVVTRFTFATTETFVDAPPECMPEVKTGVTNATETGSGQLTQTANGFAVHNSSLFTYRTDFPDGSYLTGAATGHSSAVGTGTRFVTNDVIREPRTIHAADGTAIGSVTIHFVAHTTVDTATGQATAGFEKFWFTCS